MTAYLFDVEATDRKPPLEIIEAAWMRVTPDPDLAGPSDSIPLHPWHMDSWAQRYQPSVPSTMGALAVHHILPSDLEGMPPSASFTLPADCQYLIGHSIDFDWEAIGQPLVKRICTHAMAQHVWPDATGYSQVALIYMLLGPTESTRAMVRGAHGAAMDVKMNRLILWEILKKHAEIKTWTMLWQFSEECRIPRTCPMKRYEGVPLENLETGFVDWCLSQYWLDPYFRIGLQRVLAKRYGTPVDAELDSDDDDDLPF